MKRLWFASFSLGLLLSLVPSSVATAASPCSLCILELQTQGKEGQEDQDFVVIANMGNSQATASSQNPIQLIYYNDQGVPAQSLAITASIPAHQISTYVSGALQPTNPDATKLPLSLWSGGGALQLQRTVSKVTTVYDRVGWGSAAAVTGEAQPAIAPPPGATLARKSLATGVQDTDNNSQDFAVYRSDCLGADIVDVQPFVVDTEGRSIDAWVELTGHTNERGNCMLVTKAGDVYIVPAADLPLADETRFIDRALGVNGQYAPLHIGDGTGQVWLAGVSAYGDIKLPVTTRAYTKLFVDDPTACTDVRLSELLPNPAGEDTGKEWVELTNESDTPAPLMNCQVSVGGVSYVFAPGDVLDAHEWHAYYELYNADGQPKLMSLRNSDDTLVALQRRRADGSTETIQSFEYGLAPEGQSWTRSADGWRWEPVPTPGLDNTTPPSVSGTSGPTEFPVAPEPSIPTPSSMPISITELLPNPAPPSTDEADEFIELYNPGDDTVRLEGYKLQTGNSLSYSFTLTNEVIEPRSYLVITSGASSLSLANSGGKARLVGPDGTTLSETVPYVDAPAGYTWAYIDATWRWTTAPTPGAGNVLNTPALTGLSKAKTTSAPKTGGLVKAASKSSPAKSSKASTTATGKAGDQPKELASVTPLHPAVLAVVGGLGVLYAAYEYRQDIANKLYQLRRNRSARRKNRTPVERRGTD
jgi:hypothetical protein